jgi:hypothetical protein
MLTLLYMFWDGFSAGAAATTPSGRLEYTIPDNRLKFTLPDSRMKYTVTEWA